MKQTFVQVEALRGVASFEADTLRSNWQDRRSGGAARNEIVGSRGFADIGCASAAGINAA
jgi:hypothetical protein